MQKFKKKYEKYKNKCSRLAEQYGGIKEENNGYILHGTNLFYIDEIKKNGLNGLYPQQLYNIVKKYWPYIRYLREDSYVDDFISRQEEIRNTKNIQLSFTGKLSVAKEYSENARKFGEGPSRFLSTMEKYIRQNKDNTDEIISDFKILKDAFAYPGIILAIDKEDFLDLAKLDINSLDEWEYILRYPIPAEKLYIRIDNNYIKLLSDEANIYITKIKSDHKEKIEKEKEEEEKIKTLEGWDQANLTSSPTLISYFVEKKNKSLMIRITYDTNDETKFPHYFSIYVSNYSDINLNYVIRNVLGTSDYEITNNTVSFIKDDDIKEKINIAIREVLNLVPIERRDKIIKYLPNI